MKKLLLSVIITFLTTITLNAKDMKAIFSDPQTWNGKIIPSEEVCSDFNIEAGHSPEIIVQNVPKYTRVIVLSFSDETFPGMRNGGHGVVSYSIDIGEEKVTIPSFQGETFDLPEQFTSISEHKGAKYGKEEGAYLAPCSGGKGNTYSVKIQAIDVEDKVLNTTTLILGKY